MTHAAGRISVTRTAANDVQVRQIVVTVDGEPLATLMYGESASRAIAAGPHRLRAHNTLVWKTVDFEIGPGEHVQFRAIDRPGPGTHTMLPLLGVGPIDLTLERIHA